MNSILIAYRKKLGQTQLDMAKHLGIGLTNYYKKETGKAPFNQNEMIEIMKLINLIRPDLTVNEVFFNKLF